MKLPSTILSFLIVLSAAGQSDINQTNEYGQKKGKWVTYHDDGRIDKVSFYEIVIRSELDKEEAFFGAKPNENDSTYYIDKLKWHEKYHYHENGKLKRIYSAKNSGEYLYGPNREISIASETSFDYDFLGKVNESETITFELKNNSQQAITLYPVSNISSLTSDFKAFVLPPKQASTFTFKLTLKPEYTYGKMLLKNDSFEFEFTLRGFGYHFETKDIKDGKKLTTESRFIYLRTGHETLMRLYDKKQQELLQTIPIYNPKTEIDFSQFKPGKYWLCIVDYSADQKTCCEIGIGK